LGGRHLQYLLDDLIDLLIDLGWEVTENDPVVERQKVLTQPILLEPCQDLPVIAVAVDLDGNS